MLPSINRDVTFELENEHVSNKRPFETNEDLNASPHKKAKHLVKKTIEIIFGCSKEANNSTAELPPCSYFDVINLTHLEIGEENDSEKYPSILYNTLANKINAMLRKGSLSAFFSDNLRKVDYAGELTQNCYFSGLLVLSVDEMHLSQGINRRDVFLKKNALIKPQDISSLMSLETKPLRVNDVFLTTLEQFRHIATQDPVNSQTYFYKTPDNVINMAQIYQGGYEVMRLNDYELHLEDIEILKNLSCPSEGCLTIENIANRSSLLAIRDKVKSIKAVNLCKLLTLADHLAPLKHAGPQKSKEIYDHVVKMTLAHSRGISQFFFRRMKKTFLQTALLTAKHLESKKILTLFLGRLDQSSTLNGLPKEIIDQFILTKISLEKEALEWDKKALSYDKKLIEWS